MSLLPPPSSLLSSRYSLKSHQELGEKIYDSWDCPRVEASQDYQGEVSLALGEAANVLRKKDDGEM